MESLHGALEPENVLNGKVSPTVVIDKTLTVPGACADAQAVGGAINRLEEETNTRIEETNSNTEKVKKLANIAKDTADKVGIETKKAQGTADKALLAANKGMEDVNDHANKRDNPHRVNAGQLGIARKRFIAELGTNWEGAAEPFTQNIDVEWILEEDSPIFDLIPSAGDSPTDEEEEAFQQIKNIKTADGSITVYARQKTEKTIRIQLEVHRMGEGGGTDGGSGGESGGSGSPGTPGEDGGYYIPSLIQVDADTVEMSFTGSKGGMPAVPDAEITLPKGQTGPAGKDGAAGPSGKDGVTPSMSVGTVNTLDPGSKATVTMGGTKEAPVLNFGIPRGADGAGGSGGEGTPGEDGGYYTPTVSQPDGSHLKISLPEARPECRR